MTTTTPRSGSPALGVVPRFPVPGARLAVGFLALLAEAAVLLAVLLLTRGNGWGLPGANQLPVDVAVGLTYPVAGSLLLTTARSAGGSRLLGGVLLGSGLASAVTALTAAYAVTATAATRGVLVATQVTGCLWVPGFVPLLALVPLIYPDGLLPGRRWRVAAAAAVAGTLLMTVAVGLHPEPLAGRLVLDKPLVAPGVDLLLGVPALVLVLAATAAGVVALVLRARRSRGLARRQVLVLGVAAALLLTVTALQQVLPAPVAVLSQALAVALVPLALGVAVTRHRLYDLDLALCRALVGLSVAGCLAGVYLTVFSLLRTLLPDRAVLAGAVAAGLTGLVVQPLAVRLTRSADRLFYGDRANPYAVSAALSARLSQGLDVADVPLAVCATVVDRLRLGSAQLLLDDDGEARLLASAGTPAGQPSRFPLRHRGDRVGWLAVTARPGETAVSTRDGELLATLADQAGPAVAALRLHDRLQHSREALVAAREEERRRLRRDLHDGLGATLAGVRLQLESAQELLGRPEGSQLLQSAGNGVAQAIADIRQVTDDLRPPALDDLGLPRALEALAARVRTPDLEVRVEVPDLPPLAAAVEVACYRITAEALANVAKHARARRAVVRLRSGPRNLVLEITDDGTGLRQTATGRGLGLASMRTRAEEIGGTLRITAANPGTCLHAELPLLAPA